MTAPSGGSRRDRLAGKHAVELVARADPELREDLAEVVLDRPRADEEPSADLVIGEAFAREPRDLQLLGGQILARLGRAPARPLARGQQLTRHALRERLDIHGREHLLCDAQVLAGLQPTALAAQPFAVLEVGAGELDSDPRAAEPLDRLAVQRVSDVALAHERSAARLKPEGPVGPARTRQRGQAVDGLSCALAITTARGS